MKIYRCLIIISHLLLLSCTGSDTPPNEEVNPKTDDSFCSFSIDTDADTSFEYPFFSQKILSAQVVTNGHCDSDAFSWQWSVPDERFVVEGESSQTIIINDGPLGSYMFQVSATHKNQILRVPIYINVEIKNYGYMDGRQLTDAQKEVLDQKVLSSLTQPVSEHPRLYGSNANWLSWLNSIEQYDQECVLAQSQSDLGAVQNFKSMWQRNIVDQPYCDSQKNELIEYPEASAYLKKQVNISIAANEIQRLRVMHLIRRELACDGIAYPCRYEKDERDELINVFVTAELTRLAQAPRVAEQSLWAQELNFPTDYRFNKWWHKSNSGQFMVLEAAPAFKFWTLFLDVLANTQYLPVADQTNIETELQYEIDSYLKQYETQHWSLFNGNNWTVVINSAALHWAILNYYEQPEKSKKVIGAVLKTNWLHRDYYTADGGYQEGSGYAQNTSYPYILNQHLLFKSAFNQPMHSFNWLLGPNISDWLLSNVASDSYSIDFGDSHSVQGMSTPMALDLMAPETIINMGTSQINLPISEAPENPCELKRYFSNSYFELAVNDPWLIHAGLFQDWHTLVSQCDTTNKSVSKAYPNNGFSVVSIHTEGKKDEGKPFYDHGLENQLFMTGLATDTPHREMDVGGIIWSAFGSRLLAGFGYGRIVRNYYEYDLYTNFNDHYDTHLDHVLGSSTLIIPQAFQQYTDINDDDRVQYQGQIHGGNAVISKLTLSDVDIIKLDASDVYGGTSEAKYTRPKVVGQLDYYYRWLIPFEGAHIIIDSFASKNSANIDAQEYFYAPYEENADCSKPSSKNVLVTQENAQTISLSASCNQLSNDSEQATHARLQGKSLMGGEFVLDLPEYLTSIPLVAENNLEVRNGIAIVKMKNISNQTVKRQLIRWKNNQPIKSDVRVFVLNASNLAELPLANISVKSQQGNIVIEVKLNEKVLNVALTDGQSISNVSRLNSDK